jgi:hypothetical protein
MIASTESRTFTLPVDRGVTFQFFLAHRFGHVLRDHILNKDEPWQRVLHVKEKQLENLRQQLKSDVVSDRDAAENALYPQCVGILAQGIEHSIGLPVFVEFVQERRRGIDGTPYNTRGFYFIGEHGFLVVVRENIVRTARFEGGIKKNMSRVGLFREAWKHVSSRIMRVADYLDQKDQEYVRQITVTRVSEENWVVCPM